MNYFSIVASTAGRLQGVSGGVKQACAHTYSFSLLQIIFFLWSYTYWIYNWRKNNHTNEAFTLFECKSILVNSRSRFTSISRPSLLRISTFQLLTKHGVRFSIMKSNWNIKRKLKKKNGIWFSHPHKNKTRKKEKKLSRGKKYGKTNEQKKSACKQDRLLGCHSITEDKEMSKCLS